MSTPASCAIGGSQFDIPVEVKYLDGRYEKLSVRIQRVNTGFFRISSPAHMTPGRRLTIFYCGNRIDGSILYSNPTDDGAFNVGIIRNAPVSHTRREARVPVNVKARLSRAGSTKSSRIKVVDISRSGIGFTSSIELSVGLAVCIELDDFIVFAEVRHCSKVGRGYRAGCMVEEFIHIEQSASSKSPKRTFWMKVCSAFARKPRTFGTITVAGALAHR